VTHPGFWRRFVGVASGDSNRPSQASGAPLVGASMREGGDPHRDLAGALHDVSNALTVMLGWVGEARAPDASCEAIAYALGVIEQRARIARDLARRAIGADKVADEDASLEVLLDEALEALRIMAQKMGARIRRIGDARGVLIPAAADVSQIMTNLVMNALAHAPPGSEVLVALRTGEGFIALDVVDEGAGVAPSRRASIFEGDSQREGGAGVGLRYARALARAAGGDLELVPDSAGARFRLTWPRLDAAPRPPTPVARVGVLEGTRVLIVEDDVDVTDLLEASLGARGAVVTVARSHAALGVALFRPHDAVLIDLSPIASNVRGAFDALRAALPDARLVVITGSVEALPPEVSTEGVRLVRKPFEVSEIVAALIEPRINS
jgi:CheY-like chemotaxis protein